VTARFQTNVLIQQYGNYVSLFQNVPKLFMPIFWVEQKFVMDAEKAGQIRLALYAGTIGQIVGVSLLIVGFAIISIRHFRRVFSSATTDPAKVLSKLEASGKDAVIKDYELNPLVSNPQIQIGPCC
jgi:CD36 family